MVKAVHGVRTLDARLTSPEPTEWLRSPFDVARRVVMHPTSCELHPVDYLLGEGTAIQRAVLVSRIRHEPRFAQQVDDIAHLLSRLRQLGLPQAIRLECTRTVLGTPALRRSR